MNHCEPLTPAVSICIPNWNHKRFLPRSIGSAKRAAEVLRRQNVACEIIVVDDASRDGSQRLLTAIAASDPDIDVILLSQNGGLAHARNLALRHARNGLVCFLDADNELIAQNLPLFVSAMCTTDASVVYGNILAHDGRGVVRLMSNTYIDNEFYQNNYVDAFALYNRQKMLAAGGFQEHFTSHEDWEMLLHLLAEDELLVYVPVAFGYYYIVSNSMVQSESFKHDNMRRMFSQRVAVDGVPLVPRRMFHPSIGWL